MEAAVKQIPPVVRIFGGSDELDRAAADLIAERSTKAINERGRFSVALSGGATPRGLYRLLASSAYRDRIDWKAVHVFWVDERCVPPDHRDSNFRLVHDLLLSRAPVPQGNIHRIRGEDLPETAAQAYDEELRTFFRATVPAFDLVLLGMGADGHTASLFPSHPAVKESSRFVVPVTDGPGGYRRITMTLPVLDHASMVLFLVTGQEKADAVAQVLGQGNPGQYPAGLVRSRSGSVHWLLDRTAAKGLKDSAQECP